MDVKPIKHYIKDQPPSMAEGAWYTCSNCFGSIRIGIDKQCKRCKANILWDEAIDNPM